MTLVRPLAQTGAGAGQFRRAASRTHQDHRTRATGRRRTECDVPRADFRSASPSHRPPGQGATAADDARPEARGAGQIRDPGSRDRAIHAASCRSWEPETFVKTVLVDWLRVGEVWVGADFLFGRNRTGNFSLLRSLGAHYGFRAEKIDPVRYKDFVVSSTRVRRLVSEGRVDEAGALLGRHVFIDGVVVKGAGRGRELGVPTANLETKNELLPPHGVYATTVTIDGVVRRRGHQHRAPADFCRCGSADHRSPRAGHSMADLYGQTPPPGIRPAAAGRAAIPRCRRPEGAN